MPTNRKTPCPSCGKPHRASSELCRACHTKARLQAPAPAASFPATRPVPPVSVTCTCGHQMKAATWVDAWLTFDRHVDQHHGRHSTTVTGYYKQSSIGGRRGLARKAPLTTQGGES